MVEDYVDPIDEVKPSHAIEGRGAERPHFPEQHRSITGQIIAVNRRSPRHEEAHVLDTSVGAREYTEVVVRLDSDEAEELVGKRVVVNFRP